MTQTIDKQSIDLRILVGQYVSLSGHGEMVGPCPKCGGTDRLHVKADSWFCRQCHPDWDDAIAFVQWIDNCTYPQAIAKLGGSLPTPAQRIRPTAKTHEHGPQSPTWRSQATAIARASHDTLMIDGDGAEYLESRGIQSAVWLAFKLGFKPDVALPGTWDKDKKIHTQPKQPAIVLPWYRAGRLTGLRYRFLETHKYTDARGQPRTAKSSALYDSDFSGVLYGGQALANCANEYRTLVLCEGELNAISIWQTCHAWQWDVLSLGSESAKLSPAAVAYAAKFERVIIWMDRQEIAQSLMVEIPGSYGISSPKFGDKKRDANDMLISGTLGAFLATARYGACESATERQRLLWNLYDAPALDDKTQSVLSSIKQKEAKQ